MKGIKREIIWHLIGFPVMLIFFFIAGQVVKNWKFIELALVFFIGAVWGVGYWGIRECLIDYFR